MEDNKVTKVVTTLDSGIASPIPINKSDATTIAQEQEQSLIKQREEQLKKLEINEEQKVHEPSQENQAMVEQFYQVNDLVKVVEKKNDPKLMAIMCLILLVIIIIIIIELPMLINME